MEGIQCHLLHALASWSTSICFTQMSSKIKGFKRV